MDKVIVLTGAVAAMLATASTLVDAQTLLAEADSRGRLLYETHCIACHTTQVHWRDRKLARDWTGLKEWVARWQTDLGLRWSEQDITEVARHLNQLYYRYPQSSDLRGEVKIEAETTRASRRIDGSPGFVVLQR
jgi:hypothetical protein